MSRVPIGPLTKFLAFALVTALATTVLALTIANSQGGDKTTYSARFTDVNGLLQGDDVRIAGVIVGSVDKIEIVDRRQARVEFSVDSALSVPASATAAILYKNLIGQRFLSLGQGTGGGGRLEPGGTLPVQQTRPPLDLTTLFNGFKPLFQGLDPEQVNKLSQEIVSTLQGEGGTVDSLLASTASLTSTIADRDQVIGQVIDNLNGVLQTVNSHDENLNQLITSLQQLVSGLAQDREPIGDAISSIADLTQVTGGFVEEARPPLKADIRALGDLAGQLDQARPTLEHLLEFSPYKLNKISRAASYGSWFQFYLCGLSGSVGLGDLIPRQEIPVFKSDAPRCGADPDGVEGQQAPLVPGVPPAVDQLVNGVLPNGLPEDAPALPIFGTLPTGGDR
ncbi:MCE family protein [Pseudonocardia halophobica]|uniref:ABC transporter substrate-binding protein n=1 Tax=Pseudonocardia halophobica TaxID=29401 RepID=A0A9W6L041_9PSEU|nr:MCE family protein [Pseudonocardia halophobica]GLL11282.1 ABC transporter substrate-binding protein [Pseudonocardia halophobica]